MVQFSASTQSNQVIRGEALFVRHGGSIFRFMGLALAEGWSVQSAPIDHTLRSLAPTSSGQQFRRRTYVRVVTLSRPTTVAELARESNGAITAQTLAIINGVADSATFAARSRVKTIGW